MSQESNEKEPDTIAAEPCVIQHVNEKSQNDILEKSPENDEKTGDDDIKITKAAIETGYGRQQYYYPQSHPYQQRVVGGQPVYIQVSINLFENAFGKNGNLFRLKR